MAPINARAWYNINMVPDFGTGPTLRQFAPWLRDDAERHRQILDVTERDSVIEGLPPFSDATRAQILSDLQAITEQCSTPAE